LEVELDPIEGLHQVRANTKVGFSRPTARGEATDYEKSMTPLHVGSGGALTLTQQELFAGKNNSTLDLG
jgi:hypothetical protein